MAKVELSLAPVGKDSKVIIDDQDISASVSAVEVHAGVGEVTEAVVTYVCAQYDTDISGEFSVIHMCPVSFGEVVLVVSRDDEEKAAWYPITQTFIDRGGVRRLRSSRREEGE